MPARYEFPETIANWEPLTRPRARDLEDTRKQLHWAAQLVSAIGTTLCEARGDDSHTNLEWSQTHRGLLGRATPTSPSLQALLRFADVSVELLRVADGATTPVMRIPLAGLSFAQALTKLKLGVREQLGRPALELRRPGHDLPAHRLDPAGEGAAFGGWQDHALVELTRWYTNGDRALRELRGQDPRATEVRCWPHNFDIATLLVIEREDPDDPHSEVSRNLGVGMTPGDGSYADAYWYVTLWPYPASPELPRLDGGGIWNREGWVGAVLTSTALREPQSERFAAFMRSALRACEILLDAPAV